MEPTIYQLLFRDIVLYSLFVAVAALFFRHAARSEQKADSE